MSNILQMDSGHKLWVYKTVRQFNGYEMNMDNFDRLEFNGIWFYLKV